MEARTLPVMRPQADSAYEWQPPTDVTLGPGQAGGAEFAFEHSAGLVAEGKSARLVDNEDLSSDGDFWLGMSKPDTARRRCTDRVWILPFAFGVGIMVYLRVRGVPNSNLAIMKHLANWQGRLCGVGEYADRPYLFFCSIDGALDTRHGQCRSSCPRDGNTSFGCLVGPDNALENETRPDYRTRHAFGMYCEPFDGHLLKQMIDGRHGVSSDPFAAPMRMAAEAWEPIVVAAVCALVMSSAFLGLLRYCASMLIWLGMTGLCVAPLSYGSLTMYCWKYHHYCEYVGEMDSLSTLLLGISAVTLGLLFACFLMRQTNDIELAISCIEWSVKCIMSCPSLFVHPVFVLCTRLFLLIFWQRTIMEICSLFHSDLITWKPSFTAMDIGVAFFFSFMLFWVMHYVAAHSLFISMYVTEMWYFHGGLKSDQVRIPHCLSGRGLWIALRYHQGTMIFGALCTGITQPFKLMLAALTGIARMDKNPVGKVVGAACCCLVAVYEGILEVLSRNAYMDVAMSSRPFCEATDITQEVFAADDVAHLLNGATWIFQIAGLGAISMSSFTLTQVIVGQGFWGDSFSNPDEDDYVAMPCVLALIGGLAGLFVAFPFMMLFDVVADVVLFCYIVEDLRTVEELEEVETGWVEGMRSYIAELAFCSCSIRPKKNELHDGHRGIQSWREDDLGDSTFRREAGGGQGRGKGGGKGCGKGVGQGVDAESPFERLERPKSQTRKRGR